MRFEVEAEIENRLAQHLLIAEQQRNQQTTQAAIAVQKRVNRFKLHMRQRRLDQHRHGLRAVVQKKLQLAHAVHHFFGRRRNKGRIAGARAANPVLAAPKFPRCLMAAPPARQQYAMNFAQQAQR